MPAHTLEKLQIQPAFDLEDFMNFTHESKLSSQALEHFLDLWEEWTNKLQAVHIKDGKDAWLALWLPEEVENTVDEAWNISPGEGFLINGLAQYMCMAAIEELIPQAAGGGCAPAPEMTLTLENALRELELMEPASKGSALSRRFAILTHYPFRGGCEICSLQDNCPKGQHEFAQAVLPGYERGLDD